MGTTAGGCGMGKGRGHCWWVWHGGERYCWWGRGGATADYDSIWGITECSPCYFKFSALTLAPTDIPEATPLQVAGEGGGRRGGGGRGAPLSAAGPLPAPGGGHGGLEEGNQGGQWGAGGSGELM